MCEQPYQYDQSVCNLLSLWQAAEHDLPRAHGRQAVAWQPVGNGRSRSLISSPTCVNTRTPSTSASYDRAKNDAELAEYKSLTVPARAVDLLAFWKQKAEQFPIMSLTARRLLCASTSSTHLNSVRAGFAVFCGVWDRNCNEKVLR